MTDRDRAHLDHPHATPTRRDVLRGVSALAAASALGGAAMPALGASGRAHAHPHTSGQAAGARRRVLRVAHLTDSHIQPEKGGGLGVAACLNHVHALGEREGGAVDLILTGGDNIMDAFAAGEARAALQWDLWSKTLRDHCRLPVEHCIGNHDVWGWNKGKSGTTGSEPRWGKAWACEALGLERPYRAFRRAGWRFIVLDSTFPAGEGYTARLDDEQFEWLTGELASDPRVPTLVLSHMPILGVSPFLDGQNEKSGNWVVPGAWMHIDARRIKDAFKTAPGVKVCLSGHMHLVDRADYLGVAYVCNGAVSGGWWGGSYQEFNEGYGLVDLFDDGTFEHRYVEYGWEERK